ncbi:hypothetical protein RugamoR1_63980 [Rugamonas sp. R1(2021)]
MKELDQDVRARAEKGDFEKWAETDARNLRRLKEIVEQYGWPTYEMVGEDGGRAAWLLAQHADRDADFQRKVLKLMMPLVDSGQASLKDYAYLYDRTHYPQRFGTQGECISREEWQPFEIDDLAGLAERRRKAGMPALAEYAALFKPICASSYNPSAIVPESRKTIPVPRP